MNDLEAKVSPSGSRGQSASGAVVCTTRMQMTAHQLMGAAAFSRRVGEIEQANAGETFGPFFDEILWTAAASIMLSAAAIEAYLNEFIADRAQHFAPHDDALLEGFWKAHERDELMGKIELALLLRKAPPLDRGKGAAQAMATLINLRNAVVHFRPEWTNESDTHKGVAARLKYKVEPSPFLSSEPLFPRAWASHSCTKWGVTTAFAFGRELAAHFPNGDGKSVFTQFADRCTP